MIERAVPKRTFWRTSQVLMTDGYSNWKDERRSRVPECEANLIGSLTDDGRHMPVIDLDVPVSLLPSSTEGHSHLYIDTPMSWWRYRMLLRRLHKAGIIETGFYEMSIKRKQSFLRREGITKHNERAFHEATASNRRG